MVKRYFAWSPVRNLMKKSGATIVSREAVAVLMDFLEKRSKKITEMALNFTKHAGRKKVAASDVALASKYIK